MRTKINNCSLLVGAEDSKMLPFFQNAVILIEGNMIVYAGPADNAPSFEADECIDACGALALPGLCNLHTHIPMSLLRSVGSDCNLEDWLNHHIFPTEKHLTDEAVKVGSDLSILELLRFGITSLCDMYMRVDHVAKSVQESGMRAMLSYGVVDFDESCADFPPGIAFAEKWHGACDGRIQVALAPHSVSCTTIPVLKKIKEASDALNLRVHAHISETPYDHNISIERYGMTPVQLFDSLGLFDNGAILAHCVWVTDEDIAILANSDATVAHNPISTLKLASGIAPIHKMLEAKCKVGIATDGVASNNNLNLWEEIKLMPLLQKGYLHNPTIVSPAQTFASATTVGAKAIGYNNLGVLKEGYLADIILVDTNQPHLCPCNDIASDIIYALQGSDVCMTMVNGKVLYRNGEYTTLNKNLIMQRAKKEAESLFERAQKASL